MAKYERIADDLRQKIQAGELRPGDQLPGEQVLRAEYKVSLPVVRQALDVLEAEGLVDRIHGRGTWVRVPRQRVRRTNDRYQWEKDRVRDSDAERGKTGATERDTGLTLDALEFHAEYSTIDAPAELAEIFGVPAGARLLRRIYRTSRRDEDAPLSLATSYLVYDMIAGNPELVSADNEPWPGGTQHQLFTVGIELDRIVDEVTARPPSDEEAKELDIRPGVAVLLIRKISTDTAGRVVEVSDIVAPGDRHVLAYTTQLTRWTS